MAFEPVTWSDFIESDIGDLPNSLIKTLWDGQDAYNAAARSTETIVSASTGAGVQFIFTYTTSFGIACGLVTSYTDTLQSTMNYCIENRSGACRVWELSSLVHTGPGFSEGEVSGIIINALGYPEYQKNGITFYTSLTLAPFSLFVKGALKSWNGAELTDVQIDIGSVTPTPPLPSINYASSSGRKNFRRQFNPGSDII